MCRKDYHIVHKTRGSSKMSSNVEGRKCIVKGELVAYPVAEVAKARWYRIRELDYGKKYQLQIKSHCSAYSI